MNHIASASDQVRSLILGEVNVKQMEFIADTEGLVTKKIKPNFKTLGKVYGPRMKEIAAGHDPAHHRLGGHQHRHLLRAE